MFHILQLCNGNGNVCVCVCVYSNYFSRSVFMYCVILRLIEKGK